MPAAGPSKISAADTLDAIPKARGKPPSVGSQEMRRLDYWAAREFQWPPTTAVENSGRLMAEFVLRRFRPRRDEPILALAGGADNGAAVLAAARALVHRGYSVTSLTAEPAAKLQAETRRELAQFRKEGGRSPAARPGDALPDAALVLDGILGYGLRDAPKGRARDFIEGANAHAAPTAALDLPSGLDADSGVASDPTIEADATLALAFVKDGLLKASARTYVGELYLADVGFPRPLYQEFDTTPEAVFGEGSIVRLD